MLNPITFTERVVSDFLRYQLTTYAFADERLHRQMRELLSLERTRETPLLKGPYVSLSRSFRRGASVEQLVDDGVLHPHLSALAPFSNLYGHQETAIRAIAAGRTTLISTGTGSGKTECFLYPVISRCLQLRDLQAPEGILTVIVYPMNALAEDQLGRLRGLLVGSGVTFGMYIGKTPQSAAEVPGERLSSQASPADYRARTDRLRRDKQIAAVHPYEERPSREEMQERPPRLLLTNVKQLELLLTRRRDIEMFRDARLEFLVFDEAHTFRGAAGAETACLIRRLRAFCGRDASETTCVATSATLADPERGSAAGRDFAARFFGVAPEGVELVGEEYEEEDWSEDRVPSPPLPGDPAVQLGNILDSVTGVEDEPPSPEGLKVLRATFQGMTGSVLRLDRWEEDLFTSLSANEVVYQIADALMRPRPVVDLLQELEGRLGRPLPEEEVLAWLALGAAARRDGRSLLRPVVHAFVRGISGAVVTFPPEEQGPRLWLSAEEATEAEAEGPFRLPVMACTTCGQHYFIHHAADFQFAGADPAGGEAVQDRRFWRPMEAASGGSRLVAVDRLVGSEGASEEADEAILPANCASIYLCRFCGTLHPDEREPCDGCGAAGPLVALFAVRQKEENPGYLTSCLCCGANGRRFIGQYREPARPVRATAVADVHVLAQSVIQYARRKRLLVFADNRQDAAFQAGWMADHARRYRLRSLMFEVLARGPISVGDLAGELDDRLEGDDDLSRALLPEVWQAERKEAAGRRHAIERKRFLRFQVLREVSTGGRQRLGLEPWGRMRVDYLGLQPELDFFQRWAERLDATPEELCEGVAGLLDGFRRAQILLDREDQIFSRFWREGAAEIQRGYLPLMPGVPQGLKLERETLDKKSRMKQLLSRRGDTPARQAVRSWGVGGDQVEVFLKELWKVLTRQLRLLVPVTLTGFSGRPLTGCSGAHQIDADKLVLTPHRGVYRCSTCRKGFVRATPGGACLTWRCSGTLEFESEDPDNYDLSLLDAEFAMIRPREHSAQIPPGERETLERIFKGRSEAVNTLVCTPTLELGVDIGALDSVLMRNVPPLPANYWQRAGRAGRRHRMAVNFTYARPTSHDRAYFVDPSRLLEGLIRPPSFNLSNDVMVAKHVHAAVLTRLHLLAEDAALDAALRSEIAEVLAHCFPVVVRDYLFDTDGRLRAEPLRVEALGAVIERHQKPLLQFLEQIFSQGWPPQDAEVARSDQLQALLEAMPERLQEVVDRLGRRLQWAVGQMDRLDRVRREKGTLDSDEDALYSRCDSLVKQLKGFGKRSRSEGEGYDDTYTYSVLAAEGFLPGYGLDTGAVLGFHRAPWYASEISDWTVRRPTALALREYVPGNLIYANRHRFLARSFRLEPVKPAYFQVDPAAEAVRELGGETGVAAGLGSPTLPAVPICDVDLPHHAHISDDEDYRFQMAVSVFGYEQKRHGSGKTYHWGPKLLQFRKNVYLRLVNVGAAARVRDGRVGYPLCLTCGQSRSPLASEADRDEFTRHHQERHGGNPVQDVGFYADVIADALSLQDAENRTEAFSVMESLRVAAAEILEMEIEDLQILVIGSPGDERVKALVYDPMPGGSGLLDQMLERWGEVIGAARELLTCPSQCAAACVDCLMRFRNAHYHRHLDRLDALEKMDEWGDSIRFAYDIPARLPSQTGQGKPVNRAEDTLKAMLEKAGFPGWEAQKRIELGRPLGATLPDFFFDDPTGRLDGICLYLDGMSVDLHGDPERRKRDRAIRDELVYRGYEVIEIPAGHLTDRQAMSRHFYRLGRLLLGRDGAEKVREDDRWFAVTADQERRDKTEDGAWEELIDLLDERWYPLASSIRDQGVAPPRDVEVDLMSEGRVTGHRALMAWEGRAGPVGLVAEPSAADADGTWLEVSPDSDPAEVADFIRAQLTVRS